MDKLRQLTAEERVALKQGGSTAQNWDEVLVAEDFHPSQIRSSHFEGRVEVGSKSYIAYATIANYAIGARCRIESVMRLECRHSSTFGEGVSVAAVNENGGRSVAIYRNIKAQTAYVMAMMRNRKECVDRLQQMVAERAESHRSNMGRIEDEVRIVGAKFIREVHIERGSTIEGASLLENGTVGRDAYVGVDVRARNFIFMESAQVDGGASIERCLVGENSIIANGFTAVDSLFFANCHCENGETQSIFAGPFTVTHHKSSLLIAGIFSFFNAGSGTNQSNHLFKSGAIHQAVHQRGTKFGSSAYVMAPSIEGAYTVVLGRHTRHHDTQDMPFSYLIEEDGRTMLLPAMALTSYGTVRDTEKWQKRDKRTLKRDNIHFDEFNPFLTGRMLRGVDALTRMKERDPEAKSFTYNRTTIKASMLERGIKLYNSAIAASLGVMLSKGDFSKEIADGSEWIDVAGEYMPLSVVESIMRRVAAGELSLEQIDECFDAVMEHYRDMSAAYAYDILSSLYGHPLDAEEVASAIVRSESIIASMRATTDADRRRDSGMDMMVGYGYDFRDLGEHEEDFRNTR